MTAFLQIDLPALLGASLAALACALVGNFLVLTRRAMLSDALSHVMLPGVLVAFLVTGSTAVLAMLTGGVVAALVAVGLVAFLIRTPKVEPSAALGAVFTILFAAGVLVMEQTGVARTAFDVHHVITGNLEALVWPAAKGCDSLVSPADLAELPRAIGRLALILVLVAAIVAPPRRSWRSWPSIPISPALRACRCGASISLLLVATALASVAAFESVGVVLAVAMIVCPPATARLLTAPPGPDRPLAAPLRSPSCSAATRWRRSGPPPSARKSPSTPPARSAPCPAPFCGRRSWSERGAAPPPAPGRQRQQLTAPGAQRPGQRGTLFAALNLAAQLVDLELRLLLLRSSACWTRQARLMSWICCSDRLCAGSRSTWAARERARRWP